MLGFRGRTTAQKVTCRSLSAGAYVRFLAIPCKIHGQLSLHRAGLFPPLFVLSTASIIPLILHTH